MKLWPQAWEVSGGVVASSRRRHTNLGIGTGLRNLELEALCENLPGVITADMSDAKSARMSRRSSALADVASLASKRTVPVVAASPPVEKLRAPTRFGSIFLFVASSRLRRRARRKSASSSRNRLGNVVAWEKPADADDQAASGHQITECGDRKQAVDAQRLLPQAAKERGET